MKKRICIISNGYPTRDDPQYAFIQPVAHAFADSGYCCTVIAAQSLTSIALKRKKKRPYKWVDKTQNGNEVMVIQPCYISASNVKLFTRSISSFFCDEAIIRCYNNENIDADIIYAHFWEKGIIASKIGRKRGKPVFVASGESQIRVRDYYSNHDIALMKDAIKGVIFVSTKNHEESINLDLLNENTNYAILPNGFDPAKFYQIDRKLARQELKLKSDALMAIFVGAFCDRKGSERVIKAAKEVPQLHLLMVGTGKISNSSQIVFKGRVPHDELVFYLNAADFFVLPTLKEGCCNAIVEALACGLPIISSNLSFNDDILDESNSIRINPYSIKELASAIKRICGDKQLRNKLSKGAIKTSQDMTIALRIGKILGFIESLSE